MEMKREELTLGMVAIAGAIIGTTIGVAAKSMMKPRESAVKRASKNMLKSAREFVDGMK